MSTSELHLAEIEAGADRFIVAVIATHGPQRLREAGSTGPREYSHIILAADPQTRTCYGISLSVFDRLTGRLAIVSNVFARPVASETLPPPFRRMALP